MENNKETDMDEKTVIEISLHSPLAEDNLIMKDQNMIAPVIIEELDQNALDSMNVDMNEFVEAKALEVEEITEEDMAIDIATDVEDQDILLTADEEDRLTKQFLNGELTFSEYSSRMDPDPDLETAEVENARKDSGSEESDTQKIVPKKVQKSPSTTQGRQRRKRRTLPAVLQGLMGEANLRYARGEIELAAQMCMEIIRQVPSAPEPFQTLAMIYETDQPEKSLQFALIAAHLSPKDADQWARLANLSLESGDIKQAITCYCKAIQANPKDASLYDIRAQLQEQNGDKRAYFRGYSKLLHQLEPEDSETIIKYAKILARRNMLENNNEQALEAMENIFTKCPDCITLEEVNIMTEILISLKHFQRCLKILTKYTSIWIKYRDSDSVYESQENINERRSETSDTKKAEAGMHSENSKSREIEDCDIPDDVVVDLKAKFLVTLIELDYIKFAEKLLPKFHKHENPEISGDLFLDVAETLMGKKQFELALILLEPLVNSNNFSLAAVWLRHAECWVGCKDFTKAIKSYEIVRKLSPQHLGAKSALAKLYQLKGQYNKAIEVLAQDPDSDALDSDLIYRRTLLFERTRKYDEYFHSGMLLFSRHCMHIRNKVELNAISRAMGVRQRLETLQLYRLSRGEKLEEDNVPTFSKPAESNEKGEFLLLLRMCKLACKMKNYGLFQRICFSALTSKLFEKRNAYLTYLCLISCIYNNDSYCGYNIVRQLVRICPSINTWNLLNIVIQRAEDSRHNRFIMRLLGRDEYSYLHVMHANNCLVSGTYKYALNDYVSLYKISPDALLALLASATLLQMTCQKLSVNKNQLVVQALAFFKKYAQHRGKDGQQEAYYNMARGFHQIGLLPAAVHYYKLALECDPGDVVRSNPALLDVKKEAAFNLHLIYLQSENYLMARMYLENYITI